jgi:hypothetical protein
MKRLNIFRKLIFGLPLTEAEFEVRGFSKEEAAQERLENVAKVVVTGYNTALEFGYSKELFMNIKTVKTELNGFYNEGVGMGLYTLDLFSIFNQNRFWNFIKNEGKNHEYMSYIGAGIACGVFKRPFKKFLEKASPTSGLLILNGIGFYYGYFKPKKTLKNLYVPKSVIGDSFYLECYDNGIGRALWFVNGGNPDKIKKTITEFPLSRHAAIWSGVGLAATYAGGVSQEVILQLKKLAGEHYIRLAEGSILATHTRDLAGNPHIENTTLFIFSRKTKEECNDFTKEALVRLNNQKFINGEHSLNVFFKDIRNWIKESEIKNNQKQLLNVV